MTAHPAAPRSGQRRHAPRRSVPDARETPDRPPAHSDLPTECTAPPTKEPTMSITVPAPTPRTSPGGYAWRQDRSAAALTGRSESERVGAIARSIGQAAVEILAGTRPASQLSRWTEPDVVERFTQRAAMLKLVQEQCPERRDLFEVHRAARVRRVRVCSPAPGCYEASLVVEESTRARAVALRIERSARQWRVTHLEVG